MARQKNDGRGRIGGRQKGTPNKTTSTIKAFIQDQWQKYQEDGTFEADIKNLKPFQRILVMEKLAQYLSPKMKAVDLDMTLSQDVTPSIGEHIKKSS